MNVRDMAVVALTSWKENRSGGPNGMASIINVVMNRVKKHGSDPYTECLHKFAFSSMTAPGDPQLGIGPNPLNAASWTAWLVALNLAEQAGKDNLPDITGGATLYFAPHAMKVEDTVPYTLPDGTVTVFPKSWNPAKVRFTTEIANQLFFVED